MDLNLNDYCIKIKRDLSALQELCAADPVAGLSDIYHAHVTTFPYNNFELREGAHRHPVQRASLIFFNHPRVMNQGGYCFQLNALLYSALIQLGFTPQFCTARALLGAGINHPDILCLPVTHVILLVSIAEQQFLLEPAMGMHAPRFPILINGHKASIIQGHDEFRFYLHDAEQVFVLDKKIKSEWFTIMQTELLPTSQKELEFNLLKLSRFPAKPIPIRDEKTLLTLATETGGKALFWDIQTKKPLSFKQQDGVNFTSEPLEDTVVAVQKILKNEFNIDADADYIKAFKSSCRPLNWPLPKTRWEIDLPIDERELERLGRNLR